MSSVDKVSVVMPYYNGGVYFRDALLSVANQTMPVDEVIIINDGSLDEHTSMLTQIISEFSASLTIRVLSHENCGQSASRNAGVGESTGELLAFLDQDDSWMPRHVELLSQPFLNNGELGWVYSDFNEIDKDGLLVTRSFIRGTRNIHPKSSIVEMLAEDLMILPSASILRRTAFEDTGGFDPRLRGYEDDDLFIRMFRRGWSSKFVRQDLSRFRVHPGSSSANNTFRNSRMIFFEKVSASFPDDRRLNRHYVSDVLVPRLLASTVSEYSLAIDSRSYEEARLIAKSLSEILAGRRHVRLYARAGVSLLRYPRLARMALRIRQGLPPFLRPRINPTVALKG